MKKRSYDLATQPTSEDERKLWLFAFLILLAVSISVLTLRLLNNAFLQLAFEVMIVYLPTVLAGMIALYLIVKPKISQ